MSNWPNLYNVFWMDDLYLFVMEPADRVYLDYNATTPLAPEVLQSINVALRDFWGNPSSSHDAGAWVRPSLACSMKPASVFNFL